MLHYVYFMCTILIGALLFWASSTPSRSISFADALFLVASAMTEAGLNTINLSTLNTFQQVILFTLIVLGSAILVSASVVYIRLKTFEQEFNMHISNQALHEQSNAVFPGESSFKGSDAQLRRGSQSRDDTEMMVPGKRAEDNWALQPSFAFQYAQTSSTDALDFDSDSRDVEQYKPHISLESSQSQERSTYECQLHGGRVEIASSNISSLPPPTFTRRHHRSSFDFVNSPTQRHRPLFTFAGVGADVSTSLFQYATCEPQLCLNRIFVPSNNIASSTNGYFLSSGKVARNSQFYGLTTAERRNLGGCEYKAVLFMSFLVPLYFVAWQLLGALSLGAWVANHRASITRENGLNPWWVGAFNAVSAFNNSGMSLLDANMVAFQDSVFMLISMGLFILAGNTAYPIFLRLFVWMLYSILPNNEAWKDARLTLRFLLDHPRRCYTNMFPARHTWWLALAVLTLNGIDWAAFEVLNIGNYAITVLDPHIEVVDGLFQALAVRSGGFYVVEIPKLRISLQILYVIMMYISVYPVVISMRNSNVYEERSLGIFAGESNNDDHTQKTTAFEILRGAMGLTSTPQQDDRAYFVKQQLRAQLAHDLWWIALAVFVIMIIEGGQFESNPAVFSVFNVIFEVVSAYGTVGISVGVPNQEYSFCGSWHAASKLVLVAVMIRGRHRGLPVAIDHAVQLPGALLDEAEEEDGRARTEHR